MNDLKPRWAWILSLLMFLLIHSLTLVSPYIMSNIVDVYIPEHKIHELVIAIVIFVCVPFSILILQSVYNYFLIKYVRKKGNAISIR